MAFIFLFFIHFLFFLLLHVNIKNFYVGIFSGTFEARMLKLSIHMDNELLYCGIEKSDSLLLIFPLFVHFFLSFQAKFVSQFSPEPCKLKSSNVVYICRMSGCIVGLRMRVMAPLFLFFIYFSFFLSLYNMLTFKICVGVFSETFKDRMLKLGIHMNNTLLYCIIGIENRTHCF